MRCPDDERLQAYASGRFDTNDRTVLEEHWLSCEHCRERLEAITKSILGACSRVLRATAS